MSALEGMQPTLRQVPPSRLGFDEHRVEAELSGADRRDIAAGSAADDQNACSEVSFISTSSDEQQRGVSSSARTRWMKVAASKPSTTR